MIQYYEKGERDGKSITIRKMPKDGEKNDKDQD